MRYDRFIFTGYAHCPNCRTGLIMVDKKPVCCPVCEIKKSDTTQDLDRGNHVSQVIYI